MLYGMIAAAMTRLKQALYLCVSVCAIILLTTQINIQTQTITFIHSSGSAFLTALSKESSNFTKVPKTESSYLKTVSTTKSSDSTAVPKTKSSDLKTVPTTKSSDSTTVPKTKHNVSIRTNVSKSPKNISSLDWTKNIDFVIPWSGQSKTHKEGTDVSRERNNNELVYLLRSIAINSPWFHRLYIVVNNDSLPRTDPIEIPASIANRTSILDRCTYMPNGTCPTRNSHAVKALIHRIPGLTEHFVIGDDDIFFGRPVKPSHFFENGKPYVWRKKPTWGFFGGQPNHRIYKDASVVNFSTPLSTSPSPHFWYPQLKSVCFSLERQYPEYYAFMGSHTQGRYSSLAKGISDKDNSQEECFIGVSNWEMLRTASGVYKNIDSQRYVYWDEVNINKAGFQKAVRDRAIFMNVNDRFSKNEAKYKQEMEWFHSAMEKMFPKKPAVTCIWKQFFLCNKKS